jgi:hypothetical protein
MIREALALACRSIAQLLPPQARLAARAGRAPRLVRPAPVVGLGALLLRAPGRRARPAVLWWPGG